MQKGTHKGFTVVASLAAVIAIAAELALLILTWGVWKPSMAGWILMGAVVVVSFVLTYLIQWVQALHRHGVLGR